MDPTHWTRAVGVAAAGTCLASLALAQRMEANEPLTLLVGTPQAVSPTERVDGRRSGFARTPLPTGTLRIAWRRSVGQAIDHAPLVTAAGDIVVFASRGEVLTLDSDGNDKGRVAAGIGPLGPGSILTDGTLATVNAAGEVVGTRGGIVRFHTRVGDQGVLVKVAPLALDDGGVAVANGGDLAILDSEGNVRARATIPPTGNQPPESVVWPLIAALGKIVAIGPTGTAYLWSPGRDPTRAGTFGALLNGGAALVDDHTLLAVIDSSRLVALDLVHGVAITRASAQNGLFLGPPSLRGQSAYLEELTPGATLALAFDATGREALRQSISTFTQPSAADGGLSPLAAPGHTATLVDAAGTLAFGTPDGQVGIVSPSGSVDWLGELICGRGGAGSAPGGTALPNHSAARASAGFAGIAPAGAGAFIVACEGGAGTLAKVVSATEKTDER